MACIDCILTQGVAVGACVGGTQHSVTAARSRHDCACRSCLQVHAQDMQILSLTTMLCTLQSDASSAAVDAVQILQLAAKAPAKLCQM